MLTIVLKLVMQSGELDTIVCRNKVLEVSIDTVRYDELLGLPVKRNKNVFKIK